MKKHLIFLLLLFVSISLFSQEVELVEPAPGKSIVYFIRTSSAGSLINFSFYDGEDFIGKLKPGKFIAYECDPGEHVFIGKSENTDYVEANLDADKIYVVDSQAKIGALKARIQLDPLDRNDKKYEKKKKNFLKLVSKNKGIIVNIEDEASDQDEKDIEDAAPGKTMQKYYDKKKKNDKIKQLTSDMYIETGID